MDFFDEYAESTDAVLQMAISLNAELPFGSVQEDISALRELVEKCETCTDKQGCARLLDSAPKLDQAPSYCVNKTTLEASRTSR